MKSTKRYSIIIDNLDANTISILSPKSKLNKFNTFYFNLTDLFQKHKYRKILTEIKKSEESFSIYEAQQPLGIMKLQCYFQILKKKYSKYPDLTKSNADSWIVRIEAELENLSSFLLMVQPSTPNYSDNIEQLLFFYLLYLYNNSIYCHRLGLVTENIGYITAAINLIRNLGNFITYPATFHLIQLIYLQMAHALIEDDDISTAQNYLGIVLTIAYKELEYRTMTDITPPNPTKVNIIDSDIIPYFHNNFFSCVIAFYLLGICSENLGNYDMADDSYDQSLWFMSFISDYDPKLTLYIRDLANRTNRLCDLFTLLKQTDYDSLEKNDRKKHKRPKLYFSEEDKINKYNHIKSFVEKLHLPEIDDEEANLLTEVGHKTPTVTVSKMTSTVNFINVLMSNKLKPLVKDLKKLEINNLDKETKSLIQKKLIDIKNTERMKLFQSTTHTNSNISSSYLHTYDSKQLQSNTRNTFTTIGSGSKRNRLEFNTGKSGDFTMSSTTRNKLSFQYEASSNPKPEKIQYDKYVFDKSYREKMNYLENQSKKEYIFQKNLLKIKRYDNLPSKEEETQEKMIGKCEYFYKNTLSKCFHDIKEKQESAKMKWQSTDQTFKNSKTINNETIKAMIPNQIIKRPKTRPSICETIDHLPIPNNKILDKLELEIKILDDQAKKIEYHSNQKKHKQKPKQRIRLKI